MKYRKRSFLQSCQNIEKEFLIMDILKKFFPHAFKSNEVAAFIITLIIYILIDIVCGFVIGLLVKIPILGIIFSLLGSLIGLYALVGVVLSILVFAKVLK